MRKSLTVILSLTLMIAFSLSVNADTELNISGQVRARGEISKKSFVEDAHTQEFSLLRTRVNIDATVDDNTQAFIQFQDSRMFGVPSSGGLDDNKNVDIHQAYIKTIYFQRNDWKIGGKIGRFEFNWGNQRIFGAVGWHNVGRAWDGGTLWYDNPQFNLTLGTLKAIEVNNPFSDVDFNVYIITTDIKKANLQFLGALESYADGDFLERFNLAFYYQKNHKDFDFEFTGAYQSGDVIGGFDFAAYMFAGEIGYNFKGEKNSRFALGLDYSSGDDGSDANKIKTYESSYWTGHKFNGYMDYFLGGGPNGLVDLMARGQIDFIRGWTLKGDLHLFSAAEDYLGPISGEFTKDVGLELDITVKTTRIKGIGMQWGVSYFAPKEDFANLVDKEAGFWLYEQAVVNF